jgi:glycosyltransferase involved in cell wall biosynthesis
MIFQKRRAVKNIKRWLRDKVAENSLDILWFNNLTFYDTWPLSRLAQKLGVHTVQSYEDERQELVSGDSRSLSRRLFALNSKLADSKCPRMADALVVISEYLREKYAALAGGHSKTHLVPTIIDCNEWECPPERESPCPIILYSGAFGEQDDMIGLIRALAQLRKDGRKFRCVLLGDNTREPWRIIKVKKTIDELGLTSVVDMPGFVSREHVKAHLSAASILVNIRRDGPWSRSGLSTKLSEYLASGRMVLTSAVGDVPRYLRHNESALVVSGKSTAEEIATALSTGLDSVDLRRKIGAAGLDVARRCFDVPVVATKLDKIVTGLS